MVCEGGGGVETNIETVLEGRLRTECIVFVALRGKGKVSPSRDVGRIAETAWNGLSSWSCCVSPVWPRQDETRVE